MPKPAFPFPLEVEAAEAIMLVTTKTPITMAIASVKAFTRIAICLRGSFFFCIFSILLQNSVRVDRVT
jgi:hypothetical protein